MNRKGQALIEFIIILPIFIMLMLAVFDYVRIYSEKNKLESIMEDVILDNNVNTDIKFTKKQIDGNKVEYVVSKDIDIYSPVLSVIIGNNYKVSTKRVVYE